MVALVQILSDAAQEVFMRKCLTLLFLVFHHINSLGAMFETIGAFFSEGGIRDQKTANRGMRHARHKMKEEKYARSDSK